MTQNGQWKNRETTYSNQKMSSQQANHKQTARTKNARWKHKERKSFGLNNQHGDDDRTDRCYERRTTKKRTEIKQRSSRELNKHKSRLWHEWIDRVWSNWQFLHDYNCYNPTFHHSLHYERGRFQVCNTLEGLHRHLQVRSLHVWKRDPSLTRP